MIKNGTIVPHERRCAKDSCYNFRMTGHDKVVLALTFCMGVISGMYFYTMDFKPTYLPERQDDIEERDAFSVVGRAYGGHTVAEYVHPSFRVAEDGTFEYFEGGTDAEEAPIDGVLPDTLYRTLVNEIETADLERLSLRASKDFCNTYVDGFDYIYRITMDGEQHELDTCASALPYENDLAQALMDVWIYFETGEYDASVSAEDNPPTNFAEEWLRKQFDWREESEDEPVACTMEAKICSDGSAVGRTGPNCEFAPCPGE